MTWGYLAVGAGTALGGYLSSQGGGSSDPYIQQIDPKGMFSSQKGTLGNLNQLFQDTRTYGSPTIDNSAAITALSNRRKHENRWQKKDTLAEINRLKEAQRTSGELISGSGGLFDEPGPTPDFPLTAPTQPLTQQMQGLAGQTTPAAAQSFTQGMQNLNQPGMGMDDFTRQVGDPLAEWQQNQFMNRAVPDITNRFASMDSARSSGMFDALAREAGNMNLGMNAQMAPMAFGAAQNDRTRQLQAAQIQTQAGMSGLGFGQGVAGGEQALAQADVAGNLQKFQMGLPGADPRTNQLLPYAFTPRPGGAAVGIPGSYTPSLASQIMPSVANMYGSYMGSQQPQQTQYPNAPIGGWAPTNASLETGYNMNRTGFQGTF